MVYFSAAALVVRDALAVQPVASLQTGQTFEIVETNNPENECFVFIGSSGWFGSIHPFSDTHFLLKTKHRVLQFPLAHARFFHLCPKFSIPDEVGID